MLCPLLVTAQQHNPPASLKSQITCLQTLCAWWASDRCVVQLIAWRLGNLVEVTPGNKQSGT